MSGKKILKGVKRFKSKKGVDFAVLQLVVPFSDNMAINGSIGMAVEEVFVPDNLMASINTLAIDKPINLEYDVVGGRAYLIGFSSEK